MLYSTVQNINVLLPLYGRIVRGVLLFLKYTLVGMPVTVRKLETVVTVSTTMRDVSLSLGVEQDRYELSQCLAIERLMDVLREERAYDLLGQRASAAEVVAEAFSVTADGDFGNRARIRAVARRHR